MNSLELLAVTLLYFASFALAHDNNLYTRPTAREEAIQRNTCQCSQEAGQCLLLRFTDRGWKVMAKSLNNISPSSCVALCEAWMKEPQCTGERKKLK